LNPNDSLRHTPWYSASSKAKKNSKANSFAGGKWGASSTLRKSAKNSSRKIHKTSRIYMTWVSFIWTEAALKADPEYDPARENIVKILCDLDDLHRARPYLDHWKQQGRTVEINTNKNTLEIKVNGFVMYERELS
jgi:hypothetical protein